MRLKISSIVIGLAIYLPFETVILKFLPLPDSIVSFFHFGIEVTIYVLFFILLMNNMSKGKVINKTIADRPILLFIAFAFFTMFVNKAPIMESLVDLRALIKYAFLYFIIANIDFNQDSAKRLLNAFVIVAFLQSIIVVFQHFFGISDIWYPRASDLEIAGKSTNAKLLVEGFKGGREQGAGIGTFGDTVPLANFIVISIGLITPMLLGYVKLNAYKMSFLITTWLLVLFAMFCSYSRGSILVGFLSIPLAFLLSRKLHKLFPLLLGVSLILTMFIAYTSIAPKPAQTYYNPKLVYTDPLTNFLNGFSSSYAENSLENSRGYVISEILPGFINVLPLIGYGPAMETSLTIMTNKVIGEGNFHAENVMVIADVYWVAMLACYGVLGTLLFFLLLGVLFYASYIVFKNTNYPEFKIIGLAFMIIILISIPYTFIIRTFLFRPFAFYFWMLAGLIGSEYRRLMIIKRSKAEDMRIANSIITNKEINQIY
jgi:hypothetical protein